MGELILKPIYEDSCLVVFDKPAGLVVNNSNTTFSETLQTFVSANFFKADKKDENSEFYNRAGIVHRLDKDTSGVILVAKNKDTFINLQSQFKQRSVTKVYLAVLYGLLHDKSIIVNMPIKRDSRDRFKYAISKDGRDALTQIDVIKEVDEEYTFVRVFPKTGRTHQIRVHALALKHPVVGDSIYASKFQLKHSGSVYNRLMLHAYSITFIHPKTQKNTTIISFPSKIFPTIS